LNIRLADIYLSTSFVQGKKKRKCI